MPIADLDFLVGLWEGEDVRWQIAEPWAGAMLGAMQYAEGDRTVYWEWLRWAEEGDTLVFHPLQMDRPLGAFRLAELGSNRAVFTSDADPTLQRLIFEVTGDRLATRVEGERDGVPYGGTTLLTRLR
jgi:hypothetical protein